MPLTVEDGSVIAGADSYVETDEADAYHSARGNSAWAGSSTVKEAALRRATAYIDMAYRARFPGVKREGRAQPLQWPREDAIDVRGEEIADDEIPQEIKDAVCEAALREIVEAGSLMPDLDRGGQIKSIEAGSVGITYVDGAPVKTSFQIIDGILGDILMSLPNPYFTKSERM
jgi:hypothetical protein